MPRNGDGAGDNGPIDGHEIVHGADGDDSLQHTKKVAPMPDAEDGDALPGMSASGGGSAAPLTADSEQHAINEPKKSVDSNVPSTFEQGTKRDEPHDGLPSSNLEKKFNKLDEDEVNISTASTKAQERDARAQRRADAVGESRSKGSDEAKKFGGHADVEELHGAATLEGGGSDGMGKGSGGEEDGDGKGKRRK